MPAEVSNHIDSSKSIFTKDADEAFDEFCRKYLNADNGFFRQSFRNTGKLRNKYNKPPHVKDIFTNSTASIDKSSTQAQPTPSSVVVVSTPKQEPLTPQSINNTNKKDPYANYYQNIYDYNQKKNQQQQQQQQQSQQHQQYLNGHNFNTKSNGLVKKETNETLDSNLNYYNQILNKHNSQNNKQRLVLQYDEATKTYICKIDSTRTTNQTPPPPPTIITTNGHSNNQNSIKSEYIIEPVKKYPAPYQVQPSLNDYNNTDKTSQNLVKSPITTTVTTATSINLTNGYPNNDTTETNTQQIESSQNEHNDSLSSQTMSYDEYMAQIKSQVNNSNNNKTSSNHNQSISYNNSTNGNSNQNNNDYQIESSSSSSNGYTNIYTGMSDYNNNTTENTSKTLTSVYPVEYSTQSTYTQENVQPKIETLPTKTIRTEFKNGPAIKKITQSEQKTSNVPQINKVSFLNNFKNINKEAILRQEQLMQQQRIAELNVRASKFRQEFSNRRKTVEAVVTTNGPRANGLSIQRNFSLMETTSSRNVENNTNSNGSRLPLGLRVVACGMPKDTQLPIPKNNFFIDKGNFGDDAGFWSENSYAAAIGLADGATGNIMLGYDPGEFPRYLMKLCSNLFLSTQSLKCPKELLLKAFDILQDKICYGSCTACILTLDYETQTLKIANIGDSGYRLIRNGKIVRKSEPQRITSDCPKQLDSYPWKAESRKLGVCYTDIIAEDTVCDSVKIQKDDVIILSSDGLYDNIEDEEIENLFNRVINKTY